MGISRLTRNRWLAVPMMAATIGLSAPTAANAVTTSGTSTVASSSTSQTSTTSPTDTTRSVSTPLLATDASEISLGSFVGDARGSDRFRRL